jgi:4-hydroxybenzoyl-CoA thioesterase
MSASRKLFTNRRTVRIEWGDCDPAAIVFNPRYFAFFDAATAALFEAIGKPKWRLSEIYPDFAGTPLVDSAARFLSPCRFGDDIEIETSITALGRSSFKVAHVARRGDVVAVEASETRVWTVRSTEAAAGLKSAPIPEEIRQAFGRGTGT